MAPELKARIEKIITYHEKQRELARKQIAWPGKVMRRHMKMIETLKEVLNGN